MLLQNLCAPFSRNVAFTDVTFSTDALPSHPRCWLLKLAPVITWNNSRLWFYYCSLVFVGFECSHCNNLVSCRFNTQKWLTEDVVLLCWHLCSPFVWMSVHWPYAWCWCCHVTLRRLSFCWADTSAPFSHPHTHPPSCLVTTAWLSLHWH